MTALEVLRAQARKAKRGDAETFVLLAWKAALDSVRSRPPVELVGCGSHSCIVAPPKGMGTNGPCRCDQLTLRRAVIALRSREEQRQAELAIASEAKREDAK